jgi:ornithine cyclodeaminase/alanine dehydrogenase-like protein (mu-crystallin family)
MSRELSIEVEAMVSVNAAIGASEICVTCTTSHRPLMFASDLHPGLFVAAVGADNPGKQEIDAAALAQSIVVVDSLAACAAGGDLHHAIEAGVLTERDVHGELSAIVAGRIPGRTGADQVFVFDSTGTALQDAAAASLVYRLAAQEGIGQRVLFDDRHAAGAA